MKPASLLRPLLRHVVLAMSVTAVALPLVWIGLAAFKTQIALLMGSTLFTPYWGNFDELLFSRSSDYLHNFANSLLIASASTVIVLLLSTIAAFSMHRLHWPAWVAPSVLLGSLMFHMVPPITLVGSWYVMFRSVGWGGSHGSLILAHVALNLPIGLGVMSLFVRDVPVEILEAARIDGCTVPQLLAWIVLPLVAPGLAAVGVLVFVFSWNEFAVALTLSGTRSATVPVAIAKFAQEYEIKHGVMAAGALLSIVPAIALLLAAQRHIVKGLTAGSVK
ncbi:MAG: carbohydrate ABC transporter permease [Lautropia sp.]